MEVSENLRTQLAEFDWLDDETPVSWGDDPVTSGDYALVSLEFDRTSGVLSVVVE